MSDLIVNGVNIEPFFPLRLSDTQKEKVAQLARDIAGRIDARLPVALRYLDAARIVSPHSLYLQHRHLHKVPTTSREKKTYPWNQKIHTDGARRTIAIDTYQMAQEGPISRTGWRTLHLDKVDEQRLLSFDEVREIFLGEAEDPRALENYMTTPFPRSPRFVRHYSHGVRHFLTQTDAVRDRFPRVITP